MYMFFMQFDIETYNVETYNLLIYQLENQLIGVL